MLGIHTSGSRSSAPSDKLLAVEISIASSHGFWLLTQNEELFLSYLDFPWFRDATIAQITEVELKNGNHLYWPNLDIDLSLASVRNPAQFPLVSKSSITVEQKHH
jgi:hypothetical protein